MASRYYEAEHVGAYARIRREGLLQWSDLHPADRTIGYDDFPNRAFLDRVLPADASGRRVLEYGCGTGPAACFLAARGYRVRAVDLVPDAIAIARRCATERGLAIDFAVQDVCRWGDATEQFDVVVDSFCLQSIVTDHDRSSVLAGVRQRLTSSGRYVISTAMFSPVRYYDDDRYDPRTGMVWSRTLGPVADAVEFDGEWNLSNRRHLTADALRLELEHHGFQVVEQSGPDGGDVVCELA